MDIPRFDVNLTTNAREALEMVDALILHLNEANRLIRELSGREVHLRFAPGEDGTQAVAASPGAPQPTTREDPDSGDC